MHSKLLKHITRLITLLIFLVLLFIISICMYSVRYWGDLYRYLRPNITIKRISTISELNLTIVNVDYAVDNGTTTEMSYDYGYGDENEFGDFGVIDDSSNYTDHGRVKRDDSDYTLLNRTVVLDYFFDYQEKSLVNDIVKEREYRRRNAENDNSTKLRICGDNDSGGNIEDAIFSWTAAIFLKSPNHADFSYACDGVVLSRRHVVSARKCFNSTASEADVLLVVGKRSLRDVAEKEAAYKIYRIIFQNNTEENDLAILETETDIEFNEIVKSACISLHENVAQINAENAIAVGYNASNDLSVISLVENSRSQCLHRGTGAHNGTIRLVYCVKVQEGDTVCPNLGSAYVTQSMEPPTMNPLAILTDGHGDCHETLFFTSLLENLPWIEENVNS